MVSQSQYVWKAIASFINLGITAAILLHDTLHGFRAVWGAGTDTLEANLLQQLTAMREAVLFEVFLDLRKAYDALDRDRALNLLAAYEVSTSMVRIIQTYCD